MLQNQLNKRIIVVLVSDRYFEGVLKGYDDQCLELHDVELDDGYSAGDKIFFIYNVSISYIETVD